MILKKVGEDIKQGFVFIFAQKIMQDVLRFSRQEARFSEPVDGRWKIFDFRSHWYSSVYHFTPCIEYSNAKQAKAIWMWSTSFFMIGKGGNNWVSNCKVTVELLNWFQIVRFLPNGMQLFAKMVIDTLKNTWISANPPPLFWQPNTPGASLLNK